MSCFIIKDVIDRLDKSLYEDYENTKNNLLVLWEKYYINLKEDARTDEYERLKKTYFDIGNEYEKLLSDRSKIDDDILYKRFMIMQRKTGIRMIVAAKGTRFEEEAKSFESQQANTPAGDRSITNIRFITKSRKQQSTYAKQSDIRSAYQAKSVIEYFKILFKSSEGRKKIMFALLYRMALELLRFFIIIISLRNNAKKAIYNDYLSNLVGNVVGEPTTVKIMNSNEFVAFGYFDNIIFSTRMISLLNEEEIVALSLYVYGANKNASSRRLILGSIKTIISTSVSLGVSYTYTLKYMKTGDKKYLMRLLNAEFLKDFVICLLIELLDMKLSVSSAIKFVKDMGYASQFISARNKLPRDTSSKFPNIDEETATESIKHFDNLLGVTNVKENIDKDNVSGSISLINKVIAIFKKF